MISAECPGCGVIQELPDQAAGCIGSCACGQKFRIPGLGNTRGDLESRAGCGPMVVEGGVTLLSLGLLGGLGRGIAGKGWGSLYLSLSLGLTLGICCLVIGGWSLVLAGIIWGAFVPAMLAFNLISSAA